MTAAKGNLAGQFRADGTRGFGGGVNVAKPDGGSRVFMIGGTVGFNVSKIRGGGGSLNGTGNVVRFQRNVSVTNNVALVQDGGGIFNDGGHLELRDSVFSSNASRSEGALIMESGSSRLSGVQVNANEARRAGGGVFNRGFFKSIDSVIENNSATTFPDLFDEKAGD